MKKILLGAITILSVSLGGAAVAGDAAAGKMKAAACAGCHGANGISIAPNYPNLAGQKEAYLVKALNDYKSGDRKDPTMKAMVGALSDTDIANIAAHFSGMK